MQEARIESRELGVVFENLRVVGLGASSAYIETLGSLLNPLNWIETLKNARHPPLRDILSGFEGVVRPGEMLRKRFSRLRHRWILIVPQLSLAVLVQDVAHSSKLWPITVKSTIQFLVKFITTPYPLRICTTIFGVMFSTVLKTTFHSRA